MKKKIVTNVFAFLIGIGIAYAIWYFLSPDKSDIFLERDDDDEVFDKEIEKDF